MTPQDLLDSYSKIVLFRDVLSHPYFIHLKKIANAEISGKSQHESTSDFAAYLCTEDALTPASILASSENAFALMCERREEIPVEISIIASNDISRILSMLSYTKAMVSDEHLKPLFSLRCPQTNTSPEEMTDWLKAVWRERGCGSFHEAHFFKWSADGGFTPVLNFDRVRFSDLAGYDDYKLTIKANTDILRSGSRANNILLSGSKGSGKSSMIKATANEYASNGIKTVEIAKRDVGKIDKLFSQIASRGMKFIIFIDDISFDENESSFREFKSAIEGCASVKPDNSVIYATSNLRHMVNERVQEGIEDIYSDASRNEKISLSDRFGITLYFLPPDQGEYLEMARKIAKRRNITINADFEEQAIRWAINQKGRSGRSAEQFVSSYQGIK